MSKPRQFSIGFTLVELLVVIVIVGILASVAIPNFQSLMQSQQVKAASYDMFTAFSMARSEAIKRNVSVTVTPSGNWQSGWTITAGGATIKSHGALKGSVVSSGATSVVYGRSGRVTNGATTFQIDTDATATANVRCLKIDLSGMPRTNKGIC